MNEKWASPAVNEEPFSGQEIGAGSEDGNSLVTEGTKVNVRSDPLLLEDLRSRTSFRDLKTRISRASKLSESTQKIRGRKDVYHQIPRLRNHSQRPQYFGNFEDIQIPLPQEIIMSLASL